MQHIFFRHQKYGKWVKNRIFMIFFTYSSTTISREKLKKFPEVYQNGFFFEKKKNLTQLTNIDLAHNAHLCKISSTNRVGIGVSSRVTKQKTLFRLFHQVKCLRGKVKGWKFFYNLLRKATSLHLKKL